MNDALAGNVKKPDSDQSAGPPGRIKIANALRQLLAEKDFNSITTAEISKTSGVNEALIYRYFGDKRGLLHTVLAEYTEDFLSKVIHDLKGIEGAINKLRKLIWSSIHFYHHDRVFSKILLLEVRNYPGYFQSETYNMIRQYTSLMLEIIEEGVEKKEIRSDIKPGRIRQIILGGIEHLVLPGIVFDKEIDADEIQKQLCEVLFEGIRPR